MIFSPGPATQPCEAELTLVSLAWRAAVISACRQIWLLIAVGGGWRRVGWRSASSLPLG
jgi:hypothetical protein